MNLLKPVITIIIQLMIFSYILGLEKDKCACSNSWMRNFIKIMSYLLVVLNAILIILIINDPKLSLIEMIPLDLLKVLLLIYVLVSLFYSVTCIVYFFRLHAKKDCKCAEHWKRYLLLLPLIGLTILFMGILVMLLILLIGKLQN